MHRDSIVQMNTVCERELSEFMLVEPIFRFPKPYCTKKNTCSFDAWKEEYEHMRTNEQSYTFNIRLNTSSTQETYSSVRFSTYTPIFVSSRIYKAYRNEKIYGLVTRYTHIYHMHTLAWVHWLPEDFSGRALASLLSAHCRSVSQYIYTGLQEEHEFTVLMHRNKYYMIPSLVTMPYSKISLSVSILFPSST